MINNKNLYEDKRYEIECTYNENKYIDDKDETILKVDNVCFHYTNNIDILHHINFKAGSGEFIGIIGENGAGKSTFLKLLLGQLKPCCGNINWYGKDINNYSDWHKIGYVAQRSMNINDKFPATVYEIVLANLYKSIGLFKFPNKEHRKKVEAALKMTQMEKFAKRQIGKLSGGQLQRVYISRALINSPDILILDEPTAGVDIQTIKKLFIILKHLHEKHNITIIMITHDIDKSIEFFTSIYRIDEGRLVKVNDEYNI